MIAEIRGVSERVLNVLPHMQDHIKLPRHETRDEHDRNEIESSRQNSAGLLEHNYFRFCIVFILIIDDLEDTHLFAHLLLRFLVSILRDFRFTKGLHGCFVRCVHYIIF